MEEPTYHNYPANYLQQPRNPERSKYSLRTPPGNGGKRRRKTTQKRRKRKGGKSKRRRRM